MAFGVLFILALLVLSIVAAVIFATKRGAAPDGEADHDGMSPRARRTASIIFALIALPALGLFLFVMMSTPDSTYESRIQWQSSGVDLFINGVKRNQGGAEITLEAGFPCPDLQDPLIYRSGHGLVETALASEGLEDSHLAGFQTIGATSGTEDHGYRLVFVDSVRSDGLLDPFLVLAWWDGPEAPIRGVTIRARGQGGVMTKCAMSLSGGITLDWIAMRRVQSYWHVLGLKPRLSPAAAGETYWLDGFPVGTTRLKP